GAVTVEFPTGAETVVVNMAALIDAAGAEPENTLTPNIADGVDYDLRANTSAVITIPANDFRVLHTQDSGEGSLRQAITNANLDEANNIITFATSARGTILL